MKYAFVNKGNKTIQRVENNRPLSEMLDYGKQKTLVVIPENMVMDALMIALRTSHGSLKQGLALKKQYTIDICLSYMFARLNHATKYGVSDEYIYNESMRILRTMNDDTQEYFSNALDGVAYAQGHGLNVVAQHKAGQKTLNRYLKRMRAKEAHEMYNDDVPTLAQVAIHDYVGSLAADDKQAFNLACEQVDALLTPRQKTIYHLILRGYTQRAIQQHIGIKSASQLQVHYQTIREVQAKVFADAGLTMFLYNAYALYDEYKEASEAHKKKEAERVKAYRAMRKAFHNKQE